MNTDLLNNLVGCYFVLAISYNILSFVMNDVMGRSLTSNKPLPAIVMMSLLYLIYVSEAALGTGRLDVPDGRIPAADPAPGNLHAPGGLQRRPVFLPQRMGGCPLDQRLRRHRIVPVPVFLIHIFGVRVYLGSE